MKNVKISTHPAARGTRHGERMSGFFPALKVFLHVSLMVLFLNKSICCGTHWKRLIEMLPMSPATYVLIKQYATYSSFSIETRIFKHLIQCYGNIIYDCQSSI